MTIEGSNNIEMKLRDILLSSDEALNSSSSSSNTIRPESRIINNAGIEIIDECEHEEEKESSKYNYDG